MNIDIVDQTQSGNLRVDRGPANDGKRKVRYSNYLLTVNTQLRPKSNDDSYAAGQELSRNITEMLGDMESVLRISGGTFDEETFPSISAKFAVELGPKAQRVHAHIFIEVAHRADNVQIDVQYVRAFMNGRYGKRLHIDARGVRTGKALEDYIGKLKLN